LSHKETVEHAEQAGNPPLDYTRITEPTLLNLVQQQIPAGVHATIFNILDFLVHPNNG
jgi:hypothetical protein